ncbi:MAG TPA: NAD-dependent epimerase/dehydratase family protein [Acidimicrobiales bacterium]
MRVAVTGGSGKAGRAVVRDLVASGPQVLNVDLVADPEAVAEFRQADLTEAGQAFEVLRRQEAVVHLAAIPRPYRHPVPRAAVLERVGRGRPRRTRLVPG